LNFQSQKRQGNDVLEFAEEIATGHRLSFDLRERRLDSFRLSQQYGS
jgi:hypothetical protein